MKPLLCGLVALGFFAAAAQANAEYVFSTIDLPGSTFTTLAGINNVGQILGNSSAGPFLLSGGNYTPLNLPGPPSGINDSGQIVGNIFNAGYLYSRGSYMTLSVAPAGVTVAQGINNAGEVVGYWNDRVKDHGFLYSGGSYTAIGPNEGLGANDHAMAINNLGQIVGSRGGIGWLFSGGIYSELPGGPPLPPFPTGINDSSKIVGWVGSFEPQESFVLTNGVYNTFSVLGAMITEANAINNADEIVGTYVDANGVQHGFLATPTPEPGTLALLSIGTLASIGWACRRSRPTD
jgi:probable HAF family extracellular repeat protein